MSKFIVIGAGMAGLLAAAMLRDECQQVVEAQPTLPNNHSALLRFRSSIVGDTLNIPFDRVKVMKAVVSAYGNPVGDALAYSRKTNGTATLRSSISAAGEIEDRYIAPDDLVNRMFQKVTCPVLMDNTFAMVDGAGPVISTVPMGALMKMLDYNPKPEFRSVPGFNINIGLRDVDVCATLYFPNPALPYYRASITRSRLTVEYAFPGSEATLEQLMFPIEGHPKVMKDHLADILLKFGLNEAHMVGKPVATAQRYAKILPIDDTERKRFIMWATDKHGIYSLGRFATWRPGLLLDDVVNDLRVIQNIARNGSYEHRR